MGGQKFLTSDWRGLGSKRDSRPEAGTEPDGRLAEAKGKQQRQGVSKGNQSIQRSRRKAVATAALSVWR